MLRVAVRRRERMGSFLWVSGDFEVAEVVGRRFMVFLDEASVSSGDRYGGVVVAVGRSGAACSGYQRKGSGMSENLLNLRAAGGVTVPSTLCCRLGGPGGQVAFHVHLIQVPVKQGFERLGGQVAKNAQRALRPFFAGFGESFGRMAGWGGLDRS